MPHATPIQTARTLIGWATQARAESGRGILRQLLEATALRLPPSRLGLSEYFDYRLFDARLTWRDRRRFVGWRGEPTLDRANEAPWHRYADDKLLLTHLLSDAGIAQPRLLASYQAPQAPAGDAARLTNADALAAWLRTECPFPAFVKPVHGGFGRGAALLEGWDPHGDRLRLAPDRTVPVPVFVAGMPNPGAQGSLIQECLRTAPAVAPLLSHRLSTVRVMTLDTGAGPELYRAIWKLPRAHNVVDNFESGTLGNLLAGVDLATGRVTRVIEGYGFALRVLDRHPDSQLPFEGLAVPDWEALCATTLQAARLLPGLRFQHWDVAVTDRGPVPLEVNLFAAGGTELSQLVEQRGLLESRLLALAR